MNSQSKTAHLVIKSNPESFVYDQVCIVSRDSQMITVNLAALQFVSPATEATKHIDDDIIRVHKGKTGFCILTGKNRVSGIVAAGVETTTKARLVSNSALSRTIVPPQKLSKEDLLAKLATPKGLFYKEPVAPVVKGMRENVNVFSRQLDAVAKADEAKVKVKERQVKEFLAELKANNDAMSTKLFASPQAA